tara:strand:- start:271 stop:1521 length:1251 start_codon:yes stop_codon:yes gene_type:complete
MLALVVTTILVEVARRLAPAIGLVDSPTDRKSHNGDVPLVGGIAIFGGLLVMLGPQGIIAEHWQFFAAASLLVAVGIWDDAAGIPPIARITCQAGAVLFVAIPGNAYLVDLGTILPALGTIKLGWFAIPFTVFAGVGIINAFNLSDGVDGLCGTFTLVALIGLGILAALAGKQSELLLILALSGGLIGFLIFNIRFPGRKQAKAFLGDAGSYLLGLSVLYVSVRLCQGSDRAMPPVTALWFCMIPLLDTVGMIFRRVSRGISPFTADREHIHHIFLLAKFSVTATWLGLVGVAAAGMLFGLFATLNGFSESLILAMFLSASVIYIFTINRTWQKLSFLSRSINRRSETKVDRRIIIDRRKRDQGFTINGIRVERRSGADRRQGHRRIVANQIDRESIVIKTNTRSTEASDKPAARL